MIKQVKKTYGGMLKDTSKSKTPENTYYDATYARTTATDTSTEYSLTNVKGNSLKVQFPNVTIKSNIVEYNNKSFETTILNYNGVLNQHYICGNTSSTKGLILFTSSSGQNIKLDCIWLYDDVNENIKLLYVNDLGLNKDSNVISICNYETDKIEKVYWVDGVHQLRFINIEHSTANGDKEELYNIPLSMLDAVSPFKVSQPIIKEITSGGNHTAGMIQYSYNLYKVNGSQTGTSPLTELIPLKKIDSGGDVNELVDTLPIIEIKNIDDTFDNIRVYSLKYTSLNQEPSVKVILDTAIPDSGIVTVYDDNTANRSISLEEFMFLGSNIYIPSDIEVKDNIMFISNYHEKNMSTSFDMRAFQFNKDKVSKIYHNLKSLTSWEKETIITDEFPKDNKEKHDSINLNFDEFKFMKNGRTRGGSGRLCEFMLTSTRRTSENQQYFKDNEIYRLGIILYNKYGKYGDPMWISDFKAPSGNLTGSFNSLSFKLTKEFYNEVSKINDDYLKPVGYKLLVAVRGAQDTSIIASGIISPMMVNYKNSSSPNFSNYDTRVELSKNEPKLPNFLMRNCFFNENISTDINMSNSIPLKRTKDYELMSIDGGNRSEVVVGGRFGGRTWQFNKMLQMYSPEAIFNKGISIPSNTKLYIKNAMINSYNAVWGKEIKIDNGEAVTDVRGYNSLSPIFAKYVEADSGEVNNLFDTALIEHPGGSDPNRYQRALWYRQYGVRPYNNETGAGDGEGEARIRFGVGGVNENIKPYNGFITNIDITPYDPYDGKFYNNINNNNIKKMKFTVVKASVECSTPVNKYDFSYEHEFLKVDDTYLFKYSIKEEDIESDFVSKADEGKELNIPTDVRYFESPLSVKIKNKATTRLKGVVTITVDVSALDETGVVLGTSRVIFEGGHFDLTAGNEGTIDVKYIEPNEKTSKYNIIGTPEFTSKGQSFKNYSNSGEFRYVNTLTSFKADGRKGWKHSGDFGRRIVSINAYNNHCITMVPDIIDIESLYSEIGFKSNGASMYGELIRSDEDIYLGGLYGGNKYEQKLVTKYREIGSYYSLSEIGEESIQTFNSPGDTYVQTFKFLRIAKDTDRIDQGTYQMEEIVEFPCETTINLNCRNDESVMDWNSKIVYEYDNYHKYNQVYSQKNSLIIHQAEEYYTKLNEKFGSSVIPSRQKSAGELTDSWLNIIPNDSLSLDGQYGEINKLVSFNDEIFAFQDKGIALLSVNPRVQVPTEDGIGLQLGVGGTLPTYKYVTQNSGCINEKSIVKTPSGIYYYDDINNSINLFNGQVSPLSDVSGLHSHIQKYPLKELNLNNPRYKEGVISGYDVINRDVYFTFNFKDYTDTLIFNEKMNMFIDRFNHRVGYYVLHNGKFYSSQTIQNLFLEQSGIYNKFFDSLYETSVTFLINPEVDLDTIINTIQFKSEVYDKGKDLSNSTITSYRVYNEFQDTGITPITSGLRGNTRRFVRDWNIVVGRNKGTRERIRNPWNYLTLYFNNPNNLKLVLHDILVSYTV